MARDTITPVSPQEGGQTITYLAAVSANNAVVENNGNQIILANNAGGAPVTVTVITGGTIGGKAIADNPVVVAAGATRIIGPFPVDQYNQPGTTTLHIDVSGNTNLAVINT